MNQTATPNILVDRILNILMFLGRSIYEPFRQAWRGGNSAIGAFLFGSFAFSVLILGLDGKILMAFGKGHIYDHKLYSLLQFSIAVIPVIAIGIFHTVLLTQFIASLRGIFDRAGLQNALKEYPNFISLETKDDESLKLRLTNNGLSLQEWKSKKERLEANLQVYIDTIDMVQDKGIIEITFSTKPMPSLVEIPYFEKYRGYKILVGRNRTTDFELDFTADPHLLGAGESGGGKTYFVRAALATIKFNHPETQLKITDLKNGGDFKCFENINRVDLITEPREAQKMLEFVSGLIQQRMERLKKLGHENIGEYHKSSSFLTKSKEDRLADECGHRIFVIIDEFAELVLNGGELSNPEVKAAKESLSKIARLGRSCGIHLILATQRPDRNIVDVQVRSNMTSTVCFRLNDLGGSLAVLGSKSACELPQIKGRGIFTRGADEYEIQTPFLLPQKIQEILSSQRKDTENVVKI